MKCVHSSNGFYMFGKVRELQHFLASLSNKDITVIEFIKQKLN